MNMKGIPQDIFCRILAGEAGIGTRNGDLSAAIYVSKLLATVPEVTRSYLEGLIG